MMNARLFGFWNALTEGLQTRHAARRDQDAGDFFQVVYSDPERLRGFVKAMSGLSAGAAHAIAAAFPCAIRGLDLPRFRGQLSGGGFDPPPVGPFFDDYVARPAAELKKEKR